MDAGKKYSLVLGSQSPRRKELLGWLKVPFEIICSDADESSEELDPRIMVEDVCERKAKAVFEICSKKPGFGETYFPLIVTADTTVCYEKKIYNKPTDINDARRMLLELAGKDHKVLTGVAIYAIDPVTKQRRERVFSCQTLVRFDHITQDILENYLASGESLDKAGAYGIQGQTLTFISHLEGSYSNVVGFPLSHFIDELREFLGHANDERGDWRKLFHHG